MHPRPPAQGCEQLRTFSSHFIRVSNSFLIIFGLTTFCPFFTRFQSFCTHFLSIFDHCQLFPNHTLHCNSPLLIPALFYPLPPIFKFSPLIFTNFLSFTRFLTCLYASSHIFNQSRPCPLTAAGFFNFVYMNCPFLADL